MKTTGLIRSLVLIALFLPFLSACSSASIRSVDHLATRIDRLDLEEPLPLTRYSFNTGAALNLAADQGVGTYSLEATEGGFLLTWWDQDKRESWSRTFKPEGDTLLRYVEFEIVAGPNAYYALLLQGNGEAKLIDSEQNLRAEYGRNALSYLGVQMNANKVLAPLPDSPARAAGLLPEDAITGLLVDGVHVPLKHRIELTSLLSRLRPGERVVVVVQRKGKELKLDATLGSRPLEAWNKTDG